MKVNEMHVATSASSVTGSSPSLVAIPSATRVRIDAAAAFVMRFVMIVVRNVFQLKFGKAREAKEAMKALLAINQKMAVYGTCGHTISNRETNAGTLNLASGVSFNFSR